MRLLLFNLATDADDPLLGFTTVWIRAIAKRVTSIHVITMRLGRCDLPDNVSVYSVGKEKGYSEPRRVLEFFRHLFSILGTHPIDACFCHMIPAFVFLAGPILKAKGVPIVSWYSHLHIGWLARLSMRLSNRVVTASPEVHEAFKNKCILTGHGIDLSLYTSNCEGELAKRDEKHILTVGRVSPVKDYDSFIEALALLYRSGFRNFQAQVIGSAPEQHSSYLSRIITKTEKLGLGKRVRFLGWKPPTQIASYLRNADVFVNMQEKGGKGKSVLEAMASGLPTILCTPSFNEELGEWKKDLIFRANDSSDLSGKLRYALELTKEKRSELSHLLRQIALKHDLEGLVDLLLDTFRQEIETSRSGLASV